MPDEEKDSYLITNEVAEYLHMKLNTVYSLAEQKKIPHYKVGRLLRFKRSEIDAWMEGNKKEVVDVDKQAKTIVKTARTERDIVPMVKKVIERETRVAYTPSHGKPDKIEGLGKEE